jgi:hypothetical protein
VSRIIKEIKLFTGLEVPMIELGAAGLMWMTAGAVEVIADSCQKLSYLRLKICQFTGL